MHLLRITLSILPNRIGWRRTWRTAGLLILAFAAACSSASPTVTALPPTPEFSVLVIGSDLSLGANRVAFGLIDRDGMPLRVPEAQVEAIYLAANETDGEVRDTATARFVQWSLGDQGAFTTTLDFDQTGPCTAKSPGCWALRVNTTTPGGAPVTALGNFPVNEQSHTPAIGSVAPASATPTGDGVDDLGFITSSPIPDPELYRLSIHQALQTGKPLVVVFATPRFCLTPWCGPQVEVVSQLRERIGARANFVHVEVYENPHEIEGGRPSGDIVPAVAEWGLPSEPWTFVVGEDGLVQAKFESFTTLEEIEEALEKALDA